MAKEMEMADKRIERVSTQPENPFAALIPDQQIAIVPSFRLESGVTLRNVPVAYTTRGTLSPSGDNAMVICHALTGSADVSDWWGPLLGGPGQAFDTSRFFVVCLNCMGSPYGTASPVTAKDGQPEKGRYGPEFPMTTIRDDVRLHRLVLDDLGVRQIAAVIGGSLGGMFVLEWAYLGSAYVRSIVPIATSSRHSAWGISWGEAQRQSIYADPKYEDGYYDFGDPPATGLAAARMSALLTYRSRDSFESRFGRDTPDPSRRQIIREERPKPQTPDEVHFAYHNEGHKWKRESLSRRQSERGHAPASTNNHSTSDANQNNGTEKDKGGARAAENKTNTNTNTIDINTTTALTFAPAADPQFHGPKPAFLQRKESLTGGDSALPRASYFSAQSYLRYQGAKFVGRFDSNCYIAMTRKLDTHDVSRGRAPTVALALAQIEQPTLVLGIESDGLFTFAEQREIAAHVRRARLGRIESPEGHDAFLLQFEQVNRYVVEFLQEVLPDLMARKGPGGEGGVTEQAAAVEVGELVKSSTFGEAEVGDFTAW
jgi:homoserine O-acetyltransferase